MHFDPWVFTWGIAGGGIAELLKWWQLRESLNYPEYAKRPLYWVLTILMITFGGLLALLQGIDSTKPFLALNVGLSAPIILKSLASSVPAKEPAVATRGESPVAKPSAIDFIAGR